MKRSVASNVDFLSNLPDSVIENILVCLPLRDMVKTSILSREWRYKWLSCPELVFNIEPVKHVNRILERHQGQLLKFVLGVGDRETYPKINQWIRMLPNHSLQEFTLRIFTPRPHRLTSHLFTFQNLRNLQLDNCVFDTSLGCKGFSKLVSLNLNYCTLVPETFGKFVASCPVLEIMTLNMYISFDCLEITGPKLKSFDFHGQFRSVSFKNCPILSHVGISIAAQVSFGGQFSLDLVKSLICLPSLEDLRLEPHALTDLVGYGAPNKLPITLKKLKNLNLGHMIFYKTEEISSAICFIRSCPNVQRLIITTLSHDKASVAEFLRLQNMEKPEPLTHLRTVKIQHFSGTESQMEFTKYLLASTTELEEMAIMPSEHSIMDKSEMLKT